MSRLIAAFIFALPALFSAPGAATSLNNAGPVATAPPGETAAMPLTFAWPAPGRAIVTQEGIKQGRVARLRYELIAEPVEQGRRIEVAIGTPEFLYVQGIDLKSGQVREAMAPTLALFAALPRFRVDRNGQLEQVIGLPEMIDQLSIMLRHSDSHVREFLKSPEAIAQLEAKVADYWNAWAGAWVGLTLRAGEVREVAAEAPLFSASVPQRVTVRHLGPAPECGSCVRLRLETLTEGAPLIAGMVQFLENLAARIGAPPGLPIQDLFETARQAGFVETITDARTLQPRWVQAERTITIKPKGADALIQEEKMTYSFDWSGSAN